MAYKTFVCMDIAIIGNGRVSEALVYGLALAGHEIYVGLKEDQKWQEHYLMDVFDNICLTSIENAAACADLIIIAMPAEEVREVAYLLDDVRKKIIIDASGNMPSARDVASIHTVNAIKAITSSPHVVKCFDYDGYEMLLNPLFESQTTEMFVAGESRKAKAIVKLLSRDMGFGECHDFGGDSIVPLLEDMASNWHKVITQKK